VIDRESLAADEASDESEWVGMAVNQSLSTLLESLTASAGLTWRAIDEKTIEITTPTGAAKQMDVEFYPVEGLAADAESSKRLITEIESKVAAKTWGEGPDQGVIRYDAPSKTLIVRAPQRTQAQVEVLLADFRVRR
jgi:hypothetical protein